MKFLVVDDHELIREAMRAALAELDAEAAILEASDSREAMRLIEENADLSEPTVKSHVSAILRALKVSNRTEIVVAVNALKLELLPVANL